MIRHGCASEIDPTMAFLNRLKRVSTYVRATNLALYLGRGRCDTFLSANRGTETLDRPRALTPVYVAVAHFYSLRCSPVYRRFLASSLDAERGIRREIYI